MKIIDAHTHFYPENIASAPEAWAERAAERYWGKLVGKRPDGKKSLQGFPSEKKFLLDMDSAGVERAIIQGWYWENPGTCSILNRLIADFAARHPDRISAFASINPSFPKESIAEIKRAKNLGFIGVGELHDGVQGFDFLSGQFTEIAELCAECGFPICVHLTEKSPRKYLGKCPTNFESAYAAARKCPSAKFIFAHLSGGDAAIDGFSPPDNVFFDTAAFPFTNTPADVSRAVSANNARAIYGTDYPIRLYPRKFACEQMRTIAAESKAAVPAEYAERFFSENFESLYKAGAHKAIGIK